MRERRKNKLTDMVRDLAAKFVEAESNRTSLITVTRVEMARGTDEMRIYLSVFPDQDEKQAIEFAERKTIEFRKYMATHTKVKFLPHFIFIIDKGERNRRRIEEIIQGGGLGGNRTPV